MNGMLIVVGRASNFSTLSTPTQPPAPTPEVVASPDPSLPRLRRTPFLFRFRIPMVLTDGPKVPAVFGAVGQLLRHPRPAVPPSPALVLAARLAGDALSFCVRSVVLGLPSEARSGSVAIGRAESGPLCEVALTPSLPVATAQPPTTATVAEPQHHPRSQTCSSARLRRRHLRSPRWASGAHCCNDKKRS